MIGQFFIFAAICALKAAFTEAKIEVTVDDLLWPVVDPEYFGEPDTYILDESGKSIFLNFTIIKSVPDTTIMHCVLWSLARGAYVLSTGIDMTQSVCSIVETHHIISIFLEIAGFTEEHCIAPPGVYSREKYEIPQDILPDAFPSNKYKMICEMYDGDKKLLEGNTFITSQ